MTTDEHAGNPFAVAGRWYRGNLHTHSTNSDGRKSVEDAVGWYRDHGYDFMALTDHRVLSDTSALTTDDFITIPGMEMHGPDPWLGVNYHIVGLGMHSFERSDEAWGPQEAIDRVNADGGMAILAHPYWLGQTAADMSELEGFAGMEVFNSITDRDRAKGLSAVHWDDYGDTLGITWGFATDDTHWFLNEEGRGWVMVRTTDFSQRGLLEAMRAGHFYASMGPELHDVQISDYPRAGVLLAGAARDPDYGPVGRHQPARGRRRLAHRRHVRAAPGAGVPRALHPHRGRGRRGAHRLVEPAAGLRRGEPRRVDRESWSRMKLFLKIGAVHVGGARHGCSARPIPSRR